MHHGLLRRCQKLSLQPARQFLESPTVFGVTTDVLRVVPMLHRSDQRGQRETAELVEVSFVSHSVYHL